jgi:FdhD/NarQ family
MSKTSGAPSGRSRRLPVITRPPYTVLLPQLELGDSKSRDKKPLLPVAHVVKAIELLRKTNITLIGYVRGGKMNIYSQERRVKI